MKRKIAIFCVLCLSLLTLPAGAVGKEATAKANNGFVEITANVPADFPQTSYLIADLTNVDTGEEYSFQILSENGYVEEAEVPAGSYEVTGCWVYEDFRYSVTAGTKKLTVATQTTAASLPLTVTLLDKYKTDATSSSKSSAATSSSTESSESAAETSAESSSDSSQKSSSAAVSKSSAVSHIVISIGACILFGGIVFLISAIIRKKK